MAKRVLLVLLLIVQVGCPHAWGRGGTVDQALERDLIEYHSKRDCALDVEDWLDACEDFHKRKNNPVAQQLCPPECRPSPPDVP